MRFTEETLDLLEAFIEASFHRLFTVKAIGKENGVVYELDREIDVIKEKLESL